MMAEPGRFDYWRAPWLILIALTCVHCATTPEAVPTTEKEKAFYEVTDPIPINLRISSGKDAAPIYNERVNYVQATHAFGLNGLLPTLIASAAEDAENEMREELAIKGTRAIREVSNDLGFRDAIALSIESLIEDSPWLDLQNSQRLDLPQPFVSFDTRHHALLAIDIDQTFTMSAAALYVTAAISYHPIGESDPAVTTTYIFVDVTDAKEPEPARRTARSRKMKRGGNTKPYRSVFDANLAGWTRDGGAAYHRSIERAIREITEMIDESYAAPRPSSVDSPAQLSKDVRLPPLVRGSSQRVTVDVSDESSERIRGQLQNANWVSVPRQTVAD